MPNDATGAIDPIDPRPPALPGAVVASQFWRDVAFLHWRVDARAVQPLLPAGTVADEFDGSSWVGLIAFELHGATIGPSLRFGAFSTFTEVNVRLYTVDADGRRGVVFRSLEAASLPAVLAARAMFSLPYEWSRTDQRRRGSVHEYRSARHHGPGRSAIGVDVDPSSTVDDELSRFLTARWALHQARFGRTIRLPNTHESWVLHPATATRVDDTLVDIAGLPVVTARPPDSVLFSPGVHAEFGRAQRVGAARRA